MEDLFKLWTAYLSLGVEASAGVIIGLAAIVVLRTALNFFLQLEIDKAAERKYFNTSKEGQE
jgi:uncharacterized membrane protein